MANRRLRLLLRSIRPAGGGQEVHGPELLRETVLPTNEDDAGEGRPRVPPPAPEGMGSPPDRERRRSVPCAPGVAGHGLEESTVLQGPELRGACRRTDSGTRSRISFRGKRWPGILFPHRPPRAHRPTHRD